MNRIERITHYENMLNQSRTVLSDLEKALDAYEQALPALRELEKYMASAQWRRDFEADEAGKLPADLPRGVLSEDGIYNLLEENGECLARMRGLTK